MKKSFFAVFLCCSLCFADVPELLKGVWKNPSRYVVFDTSFHAENSSVIPEIVLRAFYQWYLDRAAEPHAYSEKNVRSVNDSTQKGSAEEINMNFIPLTDELILGNGGVRQDDGDELVAENSSSGAWNLEISYPGRKEKYYVPVCVIGNRLYLKFKIKKEDSDSIPYSPILDGTIMQSGNILAGFWQDYGAAEGILTCPPVIKKELLSYYVTDDFVYHVRYWQTDADYDADAKAFFSDEKDEYSVQKHLSVSGKTYTCVTGRRTGIRNMTRSEKINEEYELNSILVKKSRRNDDGSSVSYTVRTSTICALGKPYLELCEGKSLENILEEGSKLHRPEPAPLFPPHGILDFDWSIIEDPPSDYNRRVLDLGKN